MQHKFDENQIVWIKLVTTAIDKYSYLNIVWARSIKFIEHVKHVDSGFLLLQSITD